MRTTIESEREVKTWHLSTKILIVKKGKKENCWILRKIQAQSRTTTTKKALHSASNEQRNMWKPVFMCHFKCILYTLLVPSVDRIEVGIPPSKKRDANIFRCERQVEGWKKIPCQILYIQYHRSSNCSHFTLILLLYREKTQVNIINWWVGERKAIKTDKICTAIAAFAMYVPMNASLW